MTILQSSARRSIAATSSWAVLGLALAFSANEAGAQSAPPLAGGIKASPPVLALNTGAASAETAATGAAAQPAGAASDIAPPQNDASSKKEIVVIGARASQRSAINRKKLAETATDSIVADDIGTFPDRNVAEAMSVFPALPSAATSSAKAIASACGATPGA